MPANDIICNYLLLCKDFSLVRHIYPITYTYTKRTQNTGIIQYGRKVHVYAHRYYVGLYDYV